MKPGDLRRFKDDPEHPRCSGRTFLVLDVTMFPDGGQVTDILLDGILDPGWGGSWIEDNSEAIDEAR